MALAYDALAEAFLLRGDPVAADIIRQVARWYGGRFREDDR
jgi:hypothetical protein